MSLLALLSWMLERVRSKSSKCILLQMGRCIFATLAFLTVSIIPTFCQYTNVSANVFDPNNQVYANGTFTAQFYDPGTSGKLPLLNGSTFQQRLSGSLDSFGYFSVPLADNGVIASSSGATGTQWTISICSQPYQLYLGKTYCFSYQTTITGSSVDLSAALKAVAATLPQNTSQPFVYIGVLAGIPALCTVGQVAFITDAAPGRNQYNCTATNTWTQNSGGSGTPGGSDLQVQFNNGGAFGGSQITTDAATKSNLNIPGNETVTGPAFIGGPTPWIDLQAPPYYARPLNSTANPNTTGTGSGTSLTVVSATGWQKNDGLVISGAGVATAQSTPAAPTLTILGASGSTPYSYVCVGEDPLEGLTAASPAGTANGSAVFGQQPNVITSIARASNVVSATVSGTLPYASGTYHAILMNVTWPSGAFEGLEYITITSSNTFTYSQTGPDETGTIGAKSAVRLANAFIITSAVRTGRSIVYTTDVNHNITVGPNTYYPTVIDVAGLQPVDLDGYFTVSSVTSNTITVFTGQSYGSQTETGTAYPGNTISGSPEWNQPGLYVWPTILVTCPAISGTTQDYYVYADYTASGTYNLVGSTLPRSNVFRDWGPFLTGTFTPPPAAAVPTTAPASPQNQEYVGTITNIAGTTFTVTPTIPTSVSGANVYHDQGLAIQAADNAACSTSGSIVYFSGPADLNVVTPSPQGYVVNAPFNTTTISACRELQWYGGAPVTFNDTMLDNMPGILKIKNYSGSVNYAAAAQNTYWGMSGTANPLIYAGTSACAGNLCGLQMDGLSVSAQNGNVGIFVGGEYSSFDNGYTGSYNTAIALMFQSAFQNRITNITFTGYPSYFNTWANGNQVPSGQPIYGPLIPNILVRMGNNNGMTNYITGRNSGNGKGIEFDTSNVSYGSIGNTVIENIQTLQDPQTPLVWLYGQFPMSSLTINNSVVDSVSNPIFAEFSGVLSTLNLNNDVSGGGTLISGDRVGSITMQGEYNLGGNNIGQNVQMARLNTPQSANIGPYASPLVNTPSETQQKRPLEFPYLNNFPIFWEQQTSGVTAVPSGAGTIAAGTYGICVLPVGWNGGDGGYGLTSCTSVTLNGSQGVQINATVTPGVQGYDIFVNGFRANPSLVTSLPVTYTSGCLCGYGSSPGVPGSGLPLIDQNQVATPLLRLPNSGFKDDVAAGTLTANRTTTLPDGNSYTTVVASLTTTAATSDNVTVTGMTSSGHCSLTPTNASADTLLTGTYISAKTTNQITVTHAATSGATFDVLCTPN